MRPAAPAFAFLLLLAAGARSGAQAPACPPAAPVPVAPANGFTVPVLPTGTNLIHWNPVPGAERYQFELVLVPLLTDRNRDGAAGTITSPVSLAPRYTVTGSPGTNGTLKAALPRLEHTPRRTYRWRMRAYGCGQWGAFSPHWTFYTIYQAP